MEGKGGVRGVGMRLGWAMTGTVGAVRFVCLCRGALLCTSVKATLSPPAHTHTHLHANTATDAPPIRAPHLHT